MFLAINILLLIASIGLILGLKLLSNPSLARYGNLIASISLIIAIISTDILLLTDSIKVINIVLLISSLIIGTSIGYYFSYKAEMTGVPQLVSLFNAFGGACAVIIGVNEALYFQSNSDPLFDMALILGIILGAISFSGSIIAIYKLSGKINKFNGVPLRYASQLLLLAILLFVLSHLAYESEYYSLPMFIGAITLLSLFYGIAFTLPIGGADMPVIISFLNAITGVATAFSGFVFNSPIMLIGGILVGSTGVLLTFQMCKAMNRSLKNVLSGRNKSSGKTGQNADQNENNINVVSTSEVATMLAFSKRVAIIPGFGMAVSQAQQACYEVHQKLIDNGVMVNYIIHPVAGRMPGHMNVLLAEANIDYSYILELDDVNENMSQFDVAIVIGANDVVNPAAEDDETSMIYGMPIIKAYNAKQVIVMKRGMSSGYSGEANLLFERSNCRLLFGDAKDSLRQILDELKKI